MADSKHGNVAATTQYEHTLNICTINHDTLVSEPVEHMDDLLLPNHIDRPHTARQPRRRRNRTVPDNATHQQVAPTSSEYDSDGDTVPGLISANEDEDGESESSTDLEEENEDKNTSGNNSNEDEMPPSLMDLDRNSGPPMTSTADDSIDDPSTDNVVGAGGTIANAPNNLDTQLKQYTHLIRRSTYDAHRGGRMPMSERAQLAHLKRTIARRNAASTNRNRLVQFHGLIARGKPCSILVDSGASRDFISQQMVEKLGIQTSRMDIPFGVSMADGRTVNAGRVAKSVDLTIGPLQMKRDLFVINMTGLEVILGKPFLHDFNPNLDWINNSMELTHAGKLLLLEPDGCHKSTSLGELRIPHAEAAAAVAKGERCFAVYITGSDISDRRQDDSSFQTITLNITAGETCFAVISPVLEVTDVGRLDLEALEKALTPRHDESTRISPESSQKILEFIKKHPDVATESEEPSKPRKVNGELIYHTITELPGTRPPFKQPYRMSPTEIKELKKMLDEMLQKGFLRPSSSSYGAPVMFVPKPDGTLRMVLDYRDLNAQTIKDRYPLPRDHDLFDQLQISQARFLSSLDLLYGYWQVLIHPDDIHKTAIRTPLGSYEYVVMPMGLTNAPATFQRMMESVLRPFLTDFCMVYLDDIIVYSRTEEEHVNHIIMILQALHEHGLKIKPKKCDFFKVKIKFLGHIIDVSDDDIRLLPDPSKVEAIAEWNEPTTNTELQSFIGAVNYYSKMIEDYAEQAAPLMSIMAQKWGPNEKKEFWTEEHTVAFDRLKKALMNAPVLSLPMPDKPFILQSDASNVALGGVLMQEREKDQRVVITYFSHKFTASERNWPVHERELFGLVFALRKFRHYLMGAEVRYEGDHKPLAWIKTQKHLSQRQARWLETLESFDWTFKHVPGKELVVPDALSRRPEMANLLIYLQHEAPEDLYSAAREQPHQESTLEGIMKELDALGAMASTPCLPPGYTFDDFCREHGLSPPPNSSLPPDVPEGYGFEDYCRDFGLPPTSESVMTCSSVGSAPVDLTGHLFRRTYNQHYLHTTSNPFKTPSVESSTEEVGEPEVTSGVSANVAAVNETANDSPYSPPSHTSLTPANSPQGNEAPLTIVAPDNNTTAAGDLLLSASLLHRLRHEYSNDSVAQAIIAGEEKHGFVIQRGIIMRFDSDQAQFPCIYVPSTAVSLQHDIISEFHDTIIGGHLGAAKTYEKVRRSFYWINMKNDIESFVKSCEACQRSKRRTTRPPGVNVPFAIPEMPFEIIAMDMKSGMPLTSRGNNAFWVVVDKLTRRAHIIPCNTECTSADVARMIFDNVVRHWGVPHKIISDRDPRFIAAFWQELWKLIGTRLNMSTAEHPQTDGTSERFIGTVAGMVRARALKDNRDWDIWISALEFAYNDSVNPATGYTPFQLSIGRDPAMPITMLLNGILQRPALYARDDQFVDPQVFLNRFTTILTAAKQELRRHQRVQHQELLRRASYPVHYDPGDYVWMEASTLRSPLNTMAPRRHGPYRVMRKVGLNSYELDFGDKSRRHNPVNEEKLTPYLDRTSRLPWPTHGILPGSEAAVTRLPLPPPPPTVTGENGETHPVPRGTGNSPTAIAHDDAYEAEGIETWRPDNPPDALNQPRTPLHVSTNYRNKDLAEIQQWREHADGDVIKAQVQVKYRNVDEPVWRDLHDILRGGGFKKAKEFIQRNGGIQHPHLWRTGFKEFNGVHYPFITAEYQTRNTDCEEVHRPYYVVYSDKDLENLTEHEVREAEQHNPDELGALHYVVSCHRRNPRILELCCGTKSASRAIRRMWSAAKIVTLDADPSHSPTILTDVCEWNYKDDVFPRGYFDIIWASPPCTEYSLAKTTGVRDLTGADRIVLSVRRIIDYFSPTAWFIENPHALLHLRTIMGDIDHLRTTCTYCQYGTPYKKETDIWTNVPVSLRHCNVTPCAHFRAYGHHARTAQAGPTNVGTPGTPRAEAYKIPQPLMKHLMQAALHASGYMV